MKKLLLVLILCTTMSGCALYTPPRDIQRAIELIHSATEDISVHSLEHCRARMGELIAALDKEEDPEKQRELRVKLAEEKEMKAALKELTLANQ